MEPGQLIFTLLSQAAPVATLVGYVEAGQPKYRIYPLRIPQGKPRPALTFQLISNTNDGVAACQLNEQARVQVSVFADTYDQLCALSRAVRRALAGHDAGGVSIEASNAVDHRDDAADCYFRSLDFVVDYYDPS